MIIPLALGYRIIV